MMIIKNSRLIFSNVFEIIHFKTSLKSSRFYSSSADKIEYQKKLMSRGLPKQKDLPGVKNIICVASGKGGVGKSTLSTNLALTFANQFNLKVGLLDADIYGPSIPKLMNLENHEPEIDSQTNKFVPLSNFNLKCMSMGFLVDEKAAIVWRGLMVMQAIERLMFKVNWAPLDLLVIDMPPGTGDVQLSITQHLKLNGAIIVSTPQDLALLDARRALEMFTKLNVPCLGLVQNMSSFICSKCEHEEHIFGEDGLKRLALEYPGIDLLNSIPLNKELREGSDSGRPLVITKPEHKISLVYNDLCEKIIQKLNFLE
jgi:ATP-binding protein involved in chromosome partitioning